MSISLKLYNKIGYEDVRQGMTLRIVTEGPRVKSDVEGTVSLVSPGGRVGWESGFDTADYVRVALKNDPAMSHVIRYPSYAKVETVELYEVIDAIPDEPKGVGAVVRVVDLTRPDRNMVAAKTGRDGSWVWEGTDAVVAWESIMRCVISHGYDYIKVLSKGVEL